MGKYLMTWTLDEGKIPIDRKERGEGFTMLMAMVKQDKDKGLMKDWGAFVGETNGFCVAEGTEVEIGNMIHQYVPYVFFKTIPVADYGQVEQIVAALLQ